MTPAVSPHPIVELVQTFWRLMGSNDFHAVGAVLGEGFTLEWPQTNERIRGAARFAQMNAQYPAAGPWSFTVNRIIGAGSEAVSDVSVTDGVVDARSIAFFTMADGKFSRIVEYWPEKSLPGSNRAHLVEPIS